MNYKKLSNYERLLLPQRISDAERSLEWELNSLLAEEYQAWYQYWSVYQFLRGKERSSIQLKFKEFALDELTDHAEKLLNRINELNFNCHLSTPESWKDYAQSKFETVQTNDIRSFLALNVQSETDAIIHYRQVIGIADSINDVTTSELLKDILADEEEHLSDLQDFLNDLDS